MNGKRKWGRRRWVGIILAVAVSGAVGYLALGNTGLAAQGIFGFGSNNNSSSSSSAQPPTVTIQPADVALDAVSAAGNLALVEEHYVALDVDGVVETLAVAVGDTVTAGDLLLQLDTTDLERALAQAELTAESAQLALNELRTPATAAELAQAEATLKEAQENLADVQAGPSAEEIAAARSSLAAAQSSYSELAAGPSAAELTQLSADLKKAEVALAEAQRAYDQVAWQQNVGMTQQAADLQSATIDHESAQAAYDQATAAADDSELQSAVSSIQNAQVQLDDLLNSPTPAEIASAEAQVAAAEASLSDLQAGASANDLRSAEISLQQALIDLETAHRNLAAATVTVPVAGVVVALDAEEGVRSASGTVVATLADPTQLELAIDVAEADIPNVAVGQAAEVEIDALPGKTFAGTVATISPVATGDSSSVSYPVTVRLTGDELAGVRPGMNAVATLVNDQPVAEGSWMVPTNSIRQDNGAATVIVVRDGQPVPVSVTPGTVQGEWTLVQAPDLQEGDQVIGSLTTSTNEQSGFFGGPPPGALGGPPQ
jgi:HlyD family secretion protein